MEEDIFRRPAVGGILREKLVEARLHNDHKDEAIKDAVHKLQDEMAKSRATPHYLVIDPVTRAILGRFDGPDIPPPGDGSKFAEFLNKALQ
jgi:hypothetical protein